MTAPAASGARTVRLGITPARPGDWPDLAARAKRYEALGFDTLWIPDHFVFPWDPLEPWLDAWAVLAALAVHTTRIRLGSMVTHVAYRNPAVLARTAMTVDRISNGRLDLGLGCGASAYDWTMPSGIDPWPIGERVRRLSEALQIVDGLLRGGATSYRGRFYAVEDAVLAPGPVQRPRPRLVVAAGGPRMMKLAARHADAWATEGWFRELPSGVTAEHVLRAAGDRCRLLTEEATALGRDPARIGRIFVAGFAPGLERPWRSAAAAADLVNDLLGLGFDELVITEPAAGDEGTFEEAVGRVLSILGPGTCTAARRG